jgi:rare lipoprotein A
VSGLRRPPHRREPCAPEGEPPAGRFRRSAGIALAVAALSLGACASHPTRYYAEDGPPERIPAGLANVPDAVPRVEPLNPHANRPYAALGRSFSPDTSDAPFEQRGMASWYGRQFHGNRTASGEPYDMFAMTAAHPTLPIPSYARVTRVSDGRSVIVRVNDRGPFLHDRIIDLSYAAAARLGIAGPGSGEVVVQKITARDIAAAAHAPAPAAVALARPPAVPAAAVAPPAATAPARTMVAVAGAIPAAATAITSAPLEASRAAAPLSVAGAAPAAFTVAMPATPSSPRWSVQLGAFGVPANAAALRDRLALLLSAPEADGLAAEARLPRVEQDGRFNRVLIGNLPNRELAQAWSQQLTRFLMRPTVLYVH